ncbi:MAG: Hsp33 family molecular chaperone HslO, partial [Proteobacteria bacterium]|nr:Hsp33 family molecular chaperone HslO [Pseudomonadota bacterium]
MVPDLSQPSAGLDAIQPFQVEGLHLSGRLVRLSETVDSVLRQHDYPVAVSSLLGELMALAAAL